MLPKSIKAVAISLLSAACVVIDSPKVIYADSDPPAIALGPVRCPAPGYPACGIIQPIDLILLRDAVGYGASWLSTARLTLVQEIIDGSEVTRWLFDWDQYNLTESWKRSTPRGVNFYIEFRDRLGVVLETLAIEVDRDHCARLGRKQATGRMRNVINLAYDFRMWQQTIPAKVGYC